MAYHRLVQVLSSENWEKRWNIFPQVDNSRQPNKRVIYLNWILYETKKYLFLPNQLLFLIIVKMEMCPRPCLARFSARPVIAAFASLDQLVAACWKIKKEVLEICGTITEFIKQSRCWHLINWQVTLLFGFGYLIEPFCSLFTSLNEKVRMGKKWSHTFIF